MQETFRIQQIRTADQQLSAAGEPLIHKAAYSLANLIFKQLHANGKKLYGTRVLILAGKGNNGADVLYAGACLARRGLDVTAVTVPDAHNAGIQAAKKAKVKTIELPEEHQLRQLAQKTSIWIDGMLGIGAHGKIRTPFSQWIQILNEEKQASPTGQTIYAADIPSGIDADTGQLFGQILPADITLTMGCLKPGLLCPPAAQFCGKIQVADLGYERVLSPHKHVLENRIALIEREAVNSTAPTLQNSLRKHEIAESKIRKTYRLEPADLQNIIIVPNFNDHKYSRGVLSVNTGSKEYPGAGILSVGAALRTGIGLLRYQGEIKNEIRNAHPEVICFAGKSDAWLIGSGLLDTKAAHLAYQKAAAEKAVVVLDAGAIEILAEQETKTPAVITPHTGELSKLLHCRQEYAHITPEMIAARPVFYAVTAAQKTGAVVVLKGAVTIIATPEGEVFSQGIATSWLASAGSGDVLAGIIAALLASAHAASKIPMAEKIDSLHSTHLNNRNKASAETNLRNRNFELAKIAAGGVLIHALAAAEAAEISDFAETTPVESGASFTTAGKRIRNREVRVGHPIIAGDIISKIPAIIRLALSS